MDYVRGSTISNQALKYDEGLRSFMVSIFNHMFLGLLFTAFSAYLFSSTSLSFLLYNIDPTTGAVLGMNGFGVAVAFSPLLFSFLFGAVVSRMNYLIVTLMFYLFSGLMGASLSSIFLVYTGESIIRTFLVTASMFGMMSLYGYTTKKDLTSISSFLLMGLGGIIIASLVNIFFHSPAMSFAISVGGVIVFTGLTAYDMQRIKSIYSMNSGVSKEFLSKMSIFSAFGLYMNFINLFLSLLRLIGNRRD
jgi:FtsH-binding integral membrane protein